MLRPGCDRHLAQSQHRHTGAQVDFGGGRQPGQRAIGGQIAGRADAAQFGAQIEGFAQA